MNDIGRLVITLKRKKEWIVFSLPNNQKIKLLIDHHRSNNINLSQVVIDCPKNIQISREINEGIGNHY